jgi:hypothetical protein
MHMPVVDAVNARGTRRGHWLEYVALIYCIAAALYMWICREELFYTSKTHTWSAGSNTVGAAVNH